MNVFQSLFLGFLQGVTEFLPVSSSGHLLLARELLGIPGGSMVYDLMLHLGSLAAVIVTLRRDLLALFRPPFRGLFLLALATLPAAVAGLLLSDAIERAFGGGEMLFATFAATALLLAAASKMPARSSPVGVKQALAMGCMQAVALLPGLSRSGSVLFGGLAAGGERTAVARFAFLMSIPVIAGGALVSLAGGESGLAVGWWETLCGMAAAFAGGMVSMGALTRVVARARFRPFVRYMLALALMTFCIYRVA